MSCNNDLDLLDDGWRYCDRCGEGFTFWCETNPEDNMNGYCEETGEWLCDDCWGKLLDI